MSSEKLAQLRRQRELVQEHLDWLDAEIANFSVVQPGSVDQESPAKPAPDQTDPHSTETPDPLLKPDPLSSSAEARRGCLILFFVVIGLLSAMLIGIYFWKYRDRPLLFPEKTSDASLRPHGSG